MLYIINIDACNFSLEGLLATQTGLKVYGKKEFAAKACEPVYNETFGRVTVYNMNTDQKIVDKTPINEIDLDGTVHVTAQAFVVAFNNLMKQCCCGGTTETTTTGEPTTTAAATTTLEVTTTVAPTTTLT